MRLYCDIDGVFHPTGVYGTESIKVCLDGLLLMWFDNWFQWTANLAKALEPFPHVELYITSTWRHLWQEERPRDLELFLGPLGPRFVRCVPAHICGPRQEIILADMALDNYTGPWVALDDEYTSKDYPDLTKLVLVDSKLGISQPGKVEELVSLIRG